MMKQVQEITIKVNGKIVKATVRVDAPGLTAEDFVSPQMILDVAASNRAMKYRSRHHGDRVASLEVAKSQTEVDVKAEQTLRLVA